MNEKWLYKDLTQEIIGAAMEVYRELGSGFLEYKKKNLVKICVIVWFKRGD